MLSIELSLNKKATLREAIADSIREAIIKGDLKSGEKLSEPGIAAQFGISRTPIREAFRQLDAEGFLKIIPRRGARVAPLTEKEVSEFYDIKSVLEAHAARLALPHLSEKDIEKMEWYNNEMEKEDQNKNYKLVIKYHNEFHDVFLKGCGNGYLYQLLKSLNIKFQRSRMTLALTGNSRVSIDQHREIIQAFRKRRADEVAGLVAKNALFGKQLLVDAILGRFH